jgi:hypothetical protein
VPNLALPPRKQQWIYIFHHYKGTWSLDGDMIIDFAASIRRLGTFNIVLGVIERVPQLTISPLLATKRQYVH